MDLLDDQVIIPVIRDLWPDFIFSQNEFVSAKPEFLVEFFNRFFSTWRTILLNFIREEETGDEFMNFEDFSVEVNLYCNAYKILKEIIFACPNLGDFWHAKKARTMMKCSAHFLQYACYNFEEMSSIVDNYCKQQKESEMLKGQKEAFLVQMANFAEDLGRLENIHAALKSKLENAIAEGRSEEKLAHEKHTNELLEKVNNLDSQVQHAEYELKLLEDKELEKQKQVVTQKDYDDLNHMYECLRRELEQLNEDNGDDRSDHHKIIEQSKDLEQIAQELEDLSVSALPVTQLSDLRQQIKSGDNYKLALQAEVNSLNLTILKKNRVLKILEDQLTEQKQSLNEFHESSIKEHEKETKLYSCKMIQYDYDLEELERIESERIREEEEIREIEDQEREFNVIVAKEYNKILTENKNVTEKFLEVASTLARSQD